MRLLILIGAIVTASGASKYVRTSSQGSATGNDWNNAYSLANLVANWPAAGTTIYFAGGSYPATQMTIGTGGSSGNITKLWRVRSTDSTATAAAGWSAAFDSQVIFQDLTYADSKGYIEIDGRITDGIKFVLTDGETGMLLANSTGPYTINNVTMVGPGWGTFCGYGINLTGSSTSGHLVHNCKWDGVIQQFSSNAAGGTVENCTFLNCGPGTPECHSDMIYFGGASDWTVRYSYFSNSWSQAFFFDGGGATGMKIYGNVMDMGADGTGNGIEVKQGFTWGTFDIYNNTFVKWNGSAVYLRGSDSSLINLKNNIFYSCTWNRETSAVSNIAADYNMYSGTKNALDSTHSVSSIANPFVSYASDLRLASGKAPIDAGVTLASPYTTDLDGNTRGADGTFDIGAYEYQSGGGGTTGSTGATPAVAASGVILNGITIR